MRKCLDCGATLKDFEMSCGECGSENLSLINEETTEYKEKKPKGFLILLIVIAIIGIVSAVIVSNNAKRTMPSKPIEKAVVSLYSGDLAGYINDMYGSFKADAENFFTESYGDFETYKKENEDILINAYGADYKISSKVIDVYSYSDKMIEFYQNACKELGYDIAIEDMKHVTIRVDISNDEGAQEVYIADEYSVQTGGKWYFLPKNMLVSAE